MGIIISFARQLHLVENFQTSIKSLKLKRATTTWPKTVKSKALSRGTKHGFILEIPPLTLLSDRY